MKALTTEIDLERPVENVGYEELLAKVKAAIPEFNTQHRIRPVNLELPFNAKKLFEKRADDISAATGLFVKLMLEDDPLSFSSVRLSRR
jgi:hypothetical protein